MPTCKKCGKDFEKRQHLVRHDARVHPPARPDGPGDAKSTREGEGEHQQPGDGSLPGDRWPDQQLVLATGKAGDLLPWSSQNNIMLLGPAAVTGVLVPRKWTPVMALGVLGVTKKKLRGVQRISAPRLKALREELKAVLRHYQQPEKKGGVK